MALWRRRRRGCRNGKTVPLMLHPSHCLVHRSPNLPTAKERERKNYKGQAAEQAMVISSTWTRDDAQWFQMAETRQKKLPTYSDFTKFSNQVSANSLDFQNVSKCCSHKYNQSISRVFNSILSGFSSFANTVRLRQRRRRGARRLHRSNERHDIPSSTRCATPFMASIARTSFPDSLPSLFFCR